MSEFIVKIAKSLVITLISALGVFSLAVSQGTAVMDALLLSLGTIGGFLVNLANKLEKYFTTNE